MDEYGDPCDHIQHHGMRKCPGLTPEEIERGERYRSCSFMFAGGKDMFHGDHGTIREQTAEMMANAKKYGNEPPEYMGPRSKMRPMSEIMAETPALEQRVESTPTDIKPNKQAVAAATKAVESFGL